MTKRMKISKAELATAAQVAHAERASIRIQRGDTVYILSPVEPRAEINHPASPDDALAGWLKSHGDSFAGSA